MKLKQITWNNGGYAFIGTVCIGRVEIRSKYKAPETYTAVIAELGEGKERVEGLTTMEMAKEIVEDRFKDFIREITEAE